MGDFLVNELKKEEGLWTIINGNLAFVNSEETYYHLPKDTAVLYYEVHNFSKDIFFIATERKQFHTFKSAVKDVTKRLATKSNGYRYGILAVYQKTDGTRGSNYAGVLKKEDTHVHFHVQNLRQTFSNGTLAEEEKKCIQNAGIPTTWRTTRRTTRAVLSQEKELVNQHHVKEIRYTAPHPLSEKEQFLDTLTLYYEVLSERIDPCLLSKLTICHGKMKRHSGHYSDWKKELTLQPKKYSYFFHLYWFHLYYDTRHTSTPNNITALVQQLSKQLSKTKTASRQPDQLIARFFSDYFFYHFADRFETSQKPRSLSFTAKEITESSPLLEQLIEEMQHVIKKKP